MTDARPVVEGYQNAITYLVANIAALRRRYSSQGGDATDKVNEACGYPSSLEPTNYIDFHKRLGIATRVNDFMPEECWRYFPEVYEDEDPEVETEFEADWKALVEQLNLPSYLERLDKVSGLGQYGGLLIGIDDGQRLDQPAIGFENGKPKEEFQASKQRRVMYLRVFDQSLAPVAEVVREPSDARFGQPLKYNLKIGDPTLGGSMIDGGATIDVTCHWSRFLHVADNCLTSEVLGTPRLENVFNYLFDHRKVLAGAGQMFWNGGFFGMSVDADPELLRKGATIDKEAIRKEFEEFFDGLSRVIAIQGATVKDHAPQVADPSSHLKVIIDAICITKGYPVRIFTGSERGELASSQDARTWNGRISRRHETYLTPFLVRPLVQRFIDLGVLRKPKDGFRVAWPDLEVKTEDEVATTAAKFAAALAAYANSPAAQQIFPPAEFLSIIFKLAPDDVRQVMEAAEEYILELEEKGLGPEAQLEQQQQADQLAADQLAAGGGPNDGSSANDIKAKSVAAA